MVTEDPSKFDVCFFFGGGFKAMLRIHHIVDVIFQTAHDTILRNKEGLESEVLLTLLRNIGLQTKVSQSDLMYSLRAALTGMTVRFLSTSISSSRTDSRTFQAGPPVIDIIRLLGRERTLNRLRSFHQDPLKPEARPIVTAAA